MHRGFVKGDGCSHTAWDMQRSPFTLIVISIVMCAAGIRIALTSQNLALQLFAGALSIVWAIAAIRQLRGGSRDSSGAQPPGPQ